MAKLSEHPAKGKSGSKRSAKLNKNLLNYTIARALAGAPWRKSEKSGRWLCESRTLRMSLPAAAGRRWPNAFDMEALFALLRLAQLQGSSTVCFASHNAMLKAMGQGRLARNYHKLEQALALWQVLKVSFASWYDASGSIYEARWSDKLKKSVQVPVHKVHGQGNLARTLPPPIEAMHTDSDGSLSITLSSTWCALADRYYERVPLPLPQRAAAMNLVLKLHVMPRYIVDATFAGTEVRSRSSLCWMLGAGRKLRLRDLVRAIAAAEKWYLQHGQVMKAVSQGKGIVFMFMRQQKQDKQEQMA
jgi:hypothetical protein